MEHKYIKSLFAVFALLFAGSLMFNYYVDPLNYIRANDKPYFSSERELKSRLVEEQQYKGLIMGSSKVTHLHREDLVVDGRVLNASFAAAMPEEILYFLEEKNPEIDWLAVGFDWYMFNENVFPFKDKADSELFSKRPDEILIYLVSADTLQYALKSYLNALLDKPAIYTEHGSRSTKIQEQQDHTKDNVAYEKILARLANRHFSNFEISRRRIEVVDKIIQWADTNNVKLIGWMNPLQSEVLALMKRKFSPSGQKLPKLLTSRLPHFIDLTEAYTDSRYYWKSDPYHYYPSLAANFFNTHIAPLLKSNQKIGKLKNNQQRRGP